MEVKAWLPTVWRWRGRRMRFGRRCPDQVRLMDLDPWLPRRPPLLGFGDHCIDRRLGRRRSRHTLPSAAVSPSILERDDQCLGRTQQNGTDADDKHGANSQWGPCRQVERKGEPEGNRHYCEAENEDQEHSRAVA